MSDSHSNGHADAARPFRQIEPAQPLLDMLSEHVVFQDTEHVVIWANEAALRSVDATLGEVVGERCHRIWAGRETPCPGCPVERALQTGDVQQGEIETPDGRAWLLRATPLRDEHGDIVGAVETTLDITPRKQVEETLRRHSAALAASMDGIAILDGEERYVYMNEAHAGIYGYDDPGELLGETWRVLYDSGETARFEKQILPALRRWGSWRGEATGLRRDGSRFPQEISLTSLPDGGLVSVVRNVTERKRAEEELRESEERFRTIFEHTMVGLYKTTPDGRILMANPALLSMLGYDSLEELRRRNLEAEGFEPSYNRKRFKQEIAESGAVTGLESSWTRRDGTTLHVRENAKAIRDDSGEIQYYLGTVEDITDRIMAERQISRLNETLQLINKIMRHDLLNHLSIAHSALDLYDEEDDPSFIEQASRRMLQGMDLIKRMRELESLVGSGGELQPVELRDVVDEAVADCPLSCSVEGHGLVLADDGIYPAVDNIVRNAIEHAEASHVDVTIQERNGDIMLRIADDGIGIPDMAKDKVFTERYSRGGTGGTGLGLYIVRQTIDRYGGDVAIEDNEPHGTVFVVRMPNAEQDA